MADEKSKAVKLRNTAEEYENRDDLTAAYYIFKAAADKGDHESQYKVGIYHFVGYLPVGVNRLKALRYFHLASDKNDKAKEKLSNFITEVPQMRQDKKIREKYYDNDFYVLGRCYIEGIGVEKNINKGLEICRIAGKDFCDDKAKMYLAQCYEKGIHVEKNEGTAFLYYLSTAKNNFLSKKTIKTLFAKLADFYKNGIEGVLAPDFNQYFFYRKKQGTNSTALVLEFFEHYKLLVKNESSDPQVYFNLGYLYLLKFQMEPESSEKKEGYGKNCLHYLELAAEKNHGEAQYTLGSFCINDADASEDENERLLCIEKACEYYYKSYFNLPSHSSMRAEIRMYLEDRNRIHTELHRVEEHLENENVAGNYLTKIKKIEAFQRAIPSLSVSKLLSASMNSGALLNNGNNTSNIKTTADEKKLSFTS